MMMTMVGFFKPPLTLLCLAAMLIIARRPAPADGLLLVPPFPPLSSSSSSSSATAAATAGRHHPRLSHRRRRSPSLDDPARRCRHGHQTTTRRAFPLLLLRSVSPKDDGDRDNDGKAPVVVVVDGNGSSLPPPPLPPPPPRPRTRSDDASNASNASSSSSSSSSPARLMAMMGTSPRRIFLSLASSSSIALAANLFGITSNLLTALPEELVERSGLDTYYPRGGYKRVVARSESSSSSSIGGGIGIGIGGGVPGSGVGIGRTGNGNGNGGKCSFLIPKEWVADTSLALAQAQRRARSLDYSMGTRAAAAGGGGGGAGGGVLPDAAYGPPGRLDVRGPSSNNGDTNVSVIINDGVRNFKLDTSLDPDPTMAARILLRSRPNASLISATEERRGGRGGGGGGGDGDDDVSVSVPVYQFEYAVDRGETRSALRAISVVAGSPGGDAFVTLTVVSPANDWDGPSGDRLRRVAQSFKLV